MLFRLGFAKIIVVSTSYSSEGLGVVVIVASFIKLEEQSIIEGLIGTIAIRTTFVNPCILLNFISLSFSVIDAFTYLSY